MARGTTNERAGGQARPPVRDRASAPGVSAARASAGRAIAAARAGRAPEDRSAPERWLANIRLSSFTIMIMALVVLGVVVLAPSLKLLIEQRQQYANMEKSAELQTKQVAALKTQVARWSDPAYIEAQARNRLLYVFPGEYAYLVIPDPTKTQTQNGEPISKHIQNTQVNWVGALASSVLGAGLSDQTASKLDGSGSGSDGKIGSPTTSGAPATSPAKSPGMTGVGR